MTSLGSFSIARDGQLLPRCPSRKAIGLFRYLLLRHNREATRDELAETFWPDTPAKGMHSLHVAVKLLRQYLDLHGSYIIFAQGSYAIHPETVVDDDRRTFLDYCTTGDRYWAASQHTAAQRVYEHALVQYHGDYYVDDYSSIWALAEQEQLLTRYLTTLERLGTITFLQGAYDQALTYYQWLLQRDEYREDIHSQVMRCYQRLGRRHDALQQYARCAHLLKRDLGVEPMQETQHIYCQIIKGDP